MFIVKTQQKQDLLVDLRNGLIFQKDRHGEWEQVHLRSPLITIEQGQPIQCQDYLGLLDGLIVVGIDTYSGPHPKGAVRCNCGAVRDADGECPRCDYSRCHICKTALNDRGLCPKDPQHNPLPIPPAPNYEAIHAAEEKREARTKERRAKRLKGKGVK